MAPALAGLADCKAWLGLTTAADDAVLASLVAAVSQAILADLGRTVLPTTVTEVREGGTAGLLLRHWPVGALVGCASSDRTAGSAPLAVALEPADPAPPGRPQRLTCRGGVFPRDVTVTYRAGYEVVAEAATVPAQAPFTVTAQAPYGAWACDTGVAGAPGPYTVAGGTYAFTAASAGASVALSYGYVPADLARAAVEWVADRYAARSRIGQSARTLGGQETASFVVKAMPDVVDRLLRPYRRVAG